MKRTICGLVLAGIAAALTGCSAPQLPEGYAWSVAPKTDKAYRPEPRASYRYGFDVSRMGENLPAVAQDRTGGQYDFSSALPRPDALARYEQQPAAPLYGGSAPAGAASGATAQAAAYSPASTQVQFNPNASPAAAATFTLPEPAQPVYEPTPASPAGARTHTVVKGDSYWKIAKQYYGDPMRFKDIEAANPGKNPMKLQPGDTIVIPE
jgi:5'-nucleotidase